MVNRAAQGKQANAVSRYEVTAAELPLQCPMPDMAVWNSHPRVFIKLNSEGQGRCPYCSAEFSLKQDD